MAAEGWITVEAATTYFSGRLNADDWTNASAGDKEKALTMAYRQLSGSNMFDFDDDNPHDNMKYAQCEQALYLLKFVDDIERRMALQAQGVSKAGIIQEDYGKDGSFICMQAMMLLKDDVSKRYFYSGEIDRDDTV